MAPSTYTYRFVKTSRGLNVFSYIILILTKICFCNNIVSQYKLATIHLTNE